MKFAVAASTLFAVGAQTIDLGFGGCDGGNIGAKIERLVPTSLADKKMNQMTAYVSVKEDQVDAQMNVYVSLNNPENPKKPISNVVTIDLCQESPFIPFEAPPSSSGRNVTSESGMLGGIKFWPLNCQGGLGAGVHPIRFDVELGDGHMSMNDYLQGPNFLLQFLFADNIEQPTVTACSNIRRYGVYHIGTDKQDNIMSEDEATEFTVKYCPWKSESCNPPALEGALQSPAPKDPNCPADHYRLTMNGDGLFLIAVDKDEKPLDPNENVPHNFECQNNGMFDKLYGKSKCLKFDLHVHYLVENAVDNEEDHPCAEDVDHCSMQNQLWTFTQKSTNSPQHLCMRDVDVSSCQMSYTGVDLAPTGDLTQCSTKWDVHKVFDDHYPRRRRRRKLLAKKATQTSCDDCDGNFQCFTAEEGCTSAASREVCEGLGSFKDGKFVSDGEWCSSTTPSKVCKGEDHLVHFTCMGDTSCCGSGTLTPSCIDYEYNSCCVHNGIAIACAKGQKCGDLAGAPTCIPLTELV